MESMRIRCFFKTFIKKKESKTLKVELSCHNRFNAKLTMFKIISKLRILTFKLDL